VTYQNWPFRPFQQHFVEQAQIWWDRCYLPNAAEQVLADSPQWAVVDGGPGSGKSVALSALAQHESKKAFVVSYPPDRWPGMPQALHREDLNHLRQMMANASLAVRDFIALQPEKLKGLSFLQQEFLRWLWERHLGRRAFMVFWQRLPAEIADEFENIAYEDLFPTASDPLDVQGQIDELVGLVQAFGFERIVLTVDIQNQEAQTAVSEQMTELFSWLDLMHHPGFCMITAVPTQLKQNIEPRARDRLRAQTLQWSMAECRKIAERHMQLALSTDKAVRLTEYAATAVLDEMAELIRQEYGRTVPAGWVALAETLLHLANRSHKPLPKPLQVNSLVELKQHFFARHMPMRLDLESHGVWRGPRFIGLDERLLEFVELLFRRQGRPANWDDQDMRRVAGSDNNMHSLASRTRKAIEPLTAKGNKRWVYLVNKRGEGGYWLENAIS
jgi:hypothetical protein